MCEIHANEVLLLSFIPDYFRYSVKWGNFYNVLLFYIRLTRRGLVAKLKKGNSTFCRKSRPRKFFLLALKKVLKRFL